MTGSRFTLITITTIMKQATTVLFAIAALALSSCSNEKKTWTQEEKDGWLQRCNETFASNAVREEDKEQLEGLCTCMLDATSREHTPEEAAKLGQDEVRKMLQDCNYAW